MKAWEIIEAIDDPSGLIHPEKHQAFAGGQHPLARNPIYPQHQPGGQEPRASNYEEVLATRQWRKILTKAQQYLGVPLTRQALPVIQQKLMQAMGLIDQAEAQHREELEALAIETVFELPEFKLAKKAYEQNQIVIDASLTDEVSMEGGMTSDEPEAQEPFSQERTPAEKAWIEKMVQRRHFTNAMIQGSAVSNNYLFEYAGAALDHIHPGLRRAYGILMVASELGYWMYPQSTVIQGARGQLQIGSTRVGYDDDEEEPGAQSGEEPGDEMGEEPPVTRRPKVTAQAKLFPVLIQEIIKGLTELASIPSLPRSAEDRREIVNKTDLVDMEAWHMMLGPQLWDQFVAATDAENERELAMYLYHYIQLMDVDQFNNFMRAVYSRSPEGMQMLRQLAQRVKADLAAGEGGEEAAPMGEAVQEILRRLID